MIKQAVVLVAHGTVDDLDELPEFVTRIRRGHPAPPELIEELRRRYAAIGGKSPLNDINRRVAARLETILALPVRVANRLARPYVKDVLAELAGSEVNHVVSVPLAQYSAHVYADAVKTAAGELGGKVEVSCAESWAEEPGLIEAYAEAILDAIYAIGPRERSLTVVLTAHSLPTAAVRAGDPYERLVRAAAKAVAARVEHFAGATHCVVAFQSQGMGTGPGGRPVEWLGPDLLTTIEEARARGDGHILFAPIGFLADHVEILYDLDVEARAWVTERGMAYHRTASLNDASNLVLALSRVALPLLREI